MRENKANTEEKGRCEPNESFAKFRREIVPTGSTP